jgi:hypothetical protein
MAATEGFSLLHRCKMEAPTTAMQRELQNCRGDFFWLASLAVGCSTDGLCGWRSSVARMVCYI